MSASCTIGKFICLRTIIIKLGCIQEMNFIWSVDPLCHYHLPSSCLLSIELVGYVFVVKKSGCSCASLSRSADFCVNLDRPLLCDSSSLCFGEVVAGGIDADISGESHLALVEGADLRSGVSGCVLSCL